MTQTNLAAKGERKLIAKEIELGFLRVPAGLKKEFPKQNTKIKCVLNDRTKELSYNPKYGRIFGLVGYYRKNEAEPNDIVEVDIRDGKFCLKFKKSTDREKDLTPIDVETAEEIINVSELPPQTKGNIAEQRIAELILLYGQGLLNVYKPIADIEGIDLIVIKKGIFQPIFIQVKSRFVLKNLNIQLRVKTKTFNHHHSFYLVGTYFNPQKMDLDDLLVFIPSKKYIELSNIVMRGTPTETYAASIPLKEDYSGIFSDYLIKKENLVNKLFEKFSEIEKYIK